LEFSNEGPLFANTRDVLYEDKIEMDLNDQEHMNGFWLFYKRPDWSNEKEVRLVLPRNRGSKVKLDPRWLKRLILGKNVSEQNEQVIRAWARQRLPELAAVKARYDIVEQTITLGP
jgi:hypothetical protein